MAFTHSDATIMRPSMNGSGIYDENVLIRVLEVDPNAHVIRGLVVPTTSSSLPEKEVLVRLDTKAISNIERDKIGQRAHGAWFGGQIDARTAAYCSQSPMIVAQSSRTDPSKPDILYARWLLTMGMGGDRLLHGRATLITSLESDYEGGPQFAKVRRVRLWMPNVLDMSNPRSIENVRSRLARGARNSQMPRHTQDPNSGKTIIGAALRRYAFSLIALSGDDQTVLERSPVFSSYLPDQYPDYVPEDLRYTMAQGGERQPRPIPVDEAFFDEVLQSFRAYLAQQNYPENTSIVLALACDFFPAQDSGMKTRQPYSSSNSDRYAKAYRAAMLAWPMTPSGENNLEINLAVSDVIISLSPQQKTINDYINNAVVSYPLEGTFLNHLSYQGIPLIVPPELNASEEVMNENL